MIPRSTRGSFGRKTRVVGLAVFVSSLTLPVISLGKTAWDPKPTAEETSQLRSDLGLLKAKVEGPLVASIDSLKVRLDSELQASNIRNDTISRSTDRALDILTGFGAIAGVLGTISIVLGWYRDKQHHQDYQVERKYYEDRMTESRQRESRFAEQHLKIGDAVVQKSDVMLQNQIDSIAKLGALIGLVEQTFQRQLDREKDQQKQIEGSKKYQELLEHFNLHHHRHFTTATELILGFKKYSAMQWTSLTDHERTLTDRARHIFDDVPDFVIKEEHEDEARKQRLAQAHQLFGVSAFYAKDIEAVARHLEEAKRLYSEMADRPEHLFSRAYTYHFLGLLDKNWLAPDRSVTANLQAAKENLESAWKFLRSEKKQFLIPTTLAEIQTYLDDRERNAARELLEKDVIERLESQKAEGTLDRNQRHLLLRAYLLRGNVEFIEKRRELALEWYRRGLKHEPLNPYALLSVAHASDSAESDLWRQALTALEDSGALKKHEQTVRVTALGWAVIASTRADDEQKRLRYLSELEVVQADVRPVAGRRPLFFCPVQKTMVEFNSLKDQINVAVAQTG